MPTKTRIMETDRFQVRAENGEIFTVVEQTEQIGTNVLGSQLTRWEDSLKSYCCNAGRVTRRSETEFEIIAKGKLVSRL